MTDASNEISAAAQNDTSINDGEIEKELFSLEPKILKRLTEESIKYYENDKHQGYDAQAILPRYSALLTYLNSVRHKKLLDKMQKQSDAMRRHSWIMLVLTIAILVATVTQIVLYLNR